MARRAGTCKQALVRAGFAAAPTSHGSFRLDSLTPGAYLLDVRRPAGGVSTGRLVLLPDRKKGNMELARQRESIDRDHAEIASTVAQIRGASDARDFGLTRRLLLVLQAIEEAHYASEDALMRAAGLDMPAGHQAEHAQLIETLRLINQTIVVENLRSVSPRIAAHLEAALEHMQRSDSELWATLAQQR